MGKLFGSGATITPVTTGSWHRLFWGFASGTPEYQAIAGSEFDVTELINGLSVDVPRRVFFSITQMVDGVESSLSDEVSKVLTLRETVLVADPPPPPVLSDVLIDIPVQDDMPNVEYRIEVSQ